MSKAMVAFGIIGAILLVTIVVVVIGLITTYNEMGSLGVSIDQQFANTKVAFTSRFEKLTQLIDATQLYLNYETNIFTKVAEFRSRTGQASTPADLSSIDQESNPMIIQISVAVEAYPELQGRDIVVSLMAEISGTRDVINQAEREYNALVGKYNNFFVNFPSNVFANILGFKPREYFVQPPGTEALPIVPTTP